MRTDVGYMSIRGLVKAIGTYMSPSCAIRC